MLVGSYVVSSEKRCSIGGMLRDHREAKGPRVGNESGVTRPPVLWLCTYECVEIFLRLPMSLCCHFLFKWPWLRASATIRSTLVLVVGASIGITRASPVDAGFEGAWMHMALERHNGCCKSGHKRLKNGVELSNHIRRAIGRSCTRSLLNTNTTDRSRCQVNQVILHVLNICSDPQDTGELAHCCHQLLRRGDCTGMVQ